MRTAIVVLVMALGFGGCAWADDDEDDIQPATRTVRFRSDWFSPWREVGTTGTGQLWPLPKALGDPPPRPAWPGKIGVITGPPASFYGRAGDPPLAPSQTIEDYPGVYDGLR